MWAVCISMEICLCLLNKHSRWKGKFTSVSITKKTRKKKHWMQVMYQVQTELTEVGNSLSKLKSVLNYSHIA